METASSRAVIDSYTGKIAENKHCVSRIHKCVAERRRIFSPVCAFACPVNIILRDLTIRRKKIRVMDVLHGLH